MNEPRYVLRDLPGIAALEQRLTKMEEHPNPQWAPERDGLEAHVAQLSEALFGLTDDDLYEEIQPPADLPAEEYDDFVHGRLAHYHFLYTEDEQAYLDGWRALGWDVTDGAGHLLRCVSHFDHHMVTSTLGFAGHKPDGDQALAISAANWEAKIAAEAAQFRRKR